MAINDYCTFAEVTLVLNISITATSTEGQVITTLIPQASRAIDTYTNRFRGAYAVDAEQTRYYNGSGKDTQIIDEIAAVPSFVGIAEAGDVDDATGTNGDYTTVGTDEYFPFPYNALQQTEPYFRLDLNTISGTQLEFVKLPKVVKVIGLFGFTTTANLGDDVNRACVTQVIRMFKRGQQAFQDAIANKTLGKLIFIKELDSEVKLMVQHYRKLPI